MKNDIPFRLMKISLLEMKLLINYNRISLLSLLILYFQFIKKKTFLIEKKSKHNISKYLVRLALLLCNVSGNNLKFFL